MASKMKGKSVGTVEEQTLKKKGGHHHRSKSDGMDEDQAVAEGGEASNGGSDSEDEEDTEENEEDAKDAEDEKKHKKKGKFGRGLFKMAREMSGKGSTKKEKEKEKEKEDSFQIGGPNNFRHVTAVKGDDAMAFFATVRKTGNIPNNYPGSPGVAGSPPQGGLATAGGSMATTSPRGTLAGSRSATFSATPSSPPASPQRDQLRKSAGSAMRKDRASLKADDALSKSGRIRKKTSSGDSEKVKPAKDEKDAGKEKKTSSERKGVASAEHMAVSKKESPRSSSGSVSTSKGTRPLSSPGMAPARLSHSSHTPVPPASPAPAPAAAAAAPAPAPSSSGASQMTPRWHIHPDSVDVGAKLGEGGCAVVYKGSWCGIDVAVKRLVYPTEKMVSIFTSEIQIMSELRHPRIIQFLGACLTPEQIFFVLEWAPHGDLHRVVNKDNPSWKQRLTWAIEMAQGMLYLHSQNILHMDIKSLNMLIDENYHLKVADFGLAKAMVKSDVTVQDLGSIKWLAPEVHETEHFTKQTDIYSFGMVLWELITGQYPFGELTPMKTVVATMKGDRPTIPPTTDKAFSAVMEQCWAQDPAARPDINQVLAALKAVPTPTD